jgi:hypothetical protein
MIEQSQQRTAANDHTSRLLAADELSDDALEHVVGGLARAWHAELPPAAVTPLTSARADDLPTLLT